MKELLIEIREYLQNELLETDHRVSFFPGAIEIDWCAGKDGEDIKSDLESFVKRIDEAVRQEEAVHFDERIDWKKANPVFWRDVDDIKTDKDFAPIKIGNDLVIVRQRDGKLEAIVVKGEQTKTWEHTPSGKVQYRSEPELCIGRSGCKNEPREPHTCPFKEEIHDDYESTCTCCEDCTYECAQDI